MHKAAEETWNCPSCGRPATAFIAARRALVCGSCRWIFCVALIAHIPDGQDIYGQAKAWAESGGA